MLDLEAESKESRNYSMKEDELLSSSFNVITKEQEILLDLIDKLDNPELKKDYLLKLKETLGESSKPKTHTYDLTNILNKFSNKN